MKLYIKNMVCTRCKMIVRNELDKIGAHVLNVELGEAELEGNLPEEQLKKFEAVINTYGFELIDDRKSRIIEKVKNLVIQLIHEQDGESRQNLSVYLSEKIGLDYSYISNLYTQ